MSAVYFEEVNNAWGIFINKLICQFPCSSLFSIGMKFPTNNQIFENYQQEDEDPDVPEGFCNINLERNCFDFLQDMVKAIMRLKMRTT